MFGLKYHQGLAEYWKNFYFDYSWDRVIIQGNPVGAIIRRSVSFFQLAKGLSLESMPHMWDNQSRK